MEQENILSISLKEYKEQIESLKASLQTLEKGSKEYEDVLSEIREKQSRLNEVLNDTKSNVTAADNSIVNLKTKLKELKSEFENTAIGSARFNELKEEIASTSEELSKVSKAQKSHANVVANSMNELKLQLKEMKEEVGNIDIASERFKVLSDEILNTTNKLKELEASQGTFSRNVGNYSESMVGAYKTVLDSYEDMNINLGGLKGAFDIATNASTNLGKAWKVLSAHPLITVISTLLIVLFKVKDAINSNAAAAGAWNKGMAAFEPIMNIFNTALGNAAEWLAKLFELFGSKMPAATRAMGTALVGVINIIGLVINSFVKLNTLIPVLFGYVVDYIGKGVKGISSSVGSLIANIPGLESVGESISNVGKNIGSFLNTIGKGTIDLASKATSTVDSIVNKAKDAVKSMTDSFAKAQEVNIKAAKDQSELNKRIREQEIANAESERKRAELRDKIAQTTGKDRIAMLKELRKEIEENGKREVDIAKETLRLAEYRASLSPNSKEDNDRLNTLKANIEQAKKAYTSALVEVDNTYRETMNRINNANTQRLKSEQQAQEKANRELANKQKEYVNNFKADIKTIQDTAKSLTDFLGAEEKVDTSAGTLDIDKQIEYENRRYAIVEETNAKINAKYEEAIASTEISEEQRIQLLAQYSNSLLEQQASAIEHSANITHLKVEDIKKDMTTALNAEDILNNAETLANEYTEKLASLYEADKDVAIGIVDKLNISDEDKEKILANLEQVHNDTLTGTEIFNANAEEQEHNHQIRLLEIRKQALDDMIAAGLDPNSEEVLSEKAKLNADIEAEELRHVGVMAKIKADETNNTKKHAKDTVKAYSAMTKSVGNLFGNIAKIMEDNIKHKVESGEMSEEEAKKEYERVKMLQIAEATINTVEGAITAYTSAQSLGPIAGPIVGGINAAAVTAMGIANINQIKAQQYGSDSNISPSTAKTGGQTSVIDFSGVRVNPLIDQQADINRLQSNMSINDEPQVQQVVILQSDIEDSMRQVQVREKNTTF